ncbi:hypothetical protein [Actinophytocola sp.]|uniref:hypothetical protein n=1 Tax=Actinophytocola sp. TaxID=1872138 RepID=UPI003D6C02F7
MRLGKGRRIFGHGGRAAPRNRAARRRETAIVTTVHSLQVVTTTYPRPIMNAAQSQWCTSAETSESAWRRVVRVVRRAVAGSLSRAGIRATNCSELSPATP